MLPLCSVIPPAVCSTMPSSTHKVTDRVGFLFQSFYPRVLNHDLHPTSQLSKALIRVPSNPAPICVLMNTQTRDGSDCLLSAVSVTQCIRGNNFPKSPPTPTGLIIQVSDRLSDPPCSCISPLSDCLMLTNGLQGRVSAASGGK